MQAELEEAVQAVVNATLKRALANALAGRDCSEGSQPWLICKLFDVPFERANRLGQAGIQCIKDDDDTLAAPVAHAARVRPLDQARAELGFDTLKHDPSHRALPQ